MTKKADLTVHDAPPTERIEKEDDLKVGQWYWITETIEEGWDDEKDEPLSVREVRRLTCVTAVGSNFVKLRGLDDDHNGYTSWRIHFDNFDDECTRELDPDTVIAAHVEKHRHAVNVLMDKVKQLTSRLGIIPKGELAEESEGPSNALVVAHGTKDIKAHKKALIKAKEKTLPDLFKQIEKEHKRMAAWMKGQLIPMQAQSSILEKKTEVIEDRIFTVELYAGLVERLVLIRKGKPASNEDKVHLYQRRHYMDEECLADYEAGGMDYKNIRGFDKWLLKRGHWKRLLPSPRCVVAFQIRRKRKEREGISYSDFVRIRAEEEADEQTFLYIRNGFQVYRLNTAIDFGEELFPDREQSAILGEGNLWMETSWREVKKVIGQHEYEEILADREERMERWREEVRKWKEKQKKKKKKEDRFWAPSEPHFSSKWVPCTPDSVYYDDAMKLIARQAIEHNRVAVVLQGLLDRSPAFQPHPPWQLWTPEGFSNGIELVYDTTRVLEPGDAPDFEAYRAKLNESLKKGSLTVGQEDLWGRTEADKEYSRQCVDWRVKRPYYWKHFEPFGNPGPGLIAKVARLGKKGQCTYEWERERKRYKWGADPTITTRFTCSSSHILNVDAYTPGDFKIFFADHRTRQDYLKWAPLLLAAEDHKAKKSKKRKGRKLKYEDSD